MVNEASLEPIQMVEETSYVETFTAAIDLATAKPFEMAPLVKEKCWVGEHGLEWPEHGGASRWWF